MFIFYISKIFRILNGNWDFLCKRHNGHSSHVRQVNVQWSLSLFFSPPVYEYSKRSSTGMYQKKYKAWQRSREKNTFSGHIRASPRRRADMPESWEPLTLVPSERWYHWCTPTGPGSCCRHPSHLKHTHSVNIAEHRDAFEKEVAIWGCICHLKKQERTLDTTLSAVILTKPCVVTNQWR